MKKTNINTIVPRSTRFFALIVGMALILASCAGSSTPLQPASINAVKIAGLTWTIFAIAGIVFIIVEGMLIYASFRFRSKGRQIMPKQIEGNTRLEIGWTLLPAVVLLIVFLLSIGTLRSLFYQPAQAASASGDPPATLNVRVIGHQWWWEFDYPDQHIITANELHIPENTLVSLDIESIDVIHSFWVPQLTQKQDAIPGHITTIYINAPTPGTYLGQCSEFCGAQHANMLARVIVDPTDQFQAWVTQQQAPVAALSGEAAQGEQVFLSGACVGCHTINGTTAQGKVGPNLTHFASRNVFAGASQENTPQNVAHWLADPQAVKPGNLMPNLHLSQDAINKLVAFLESLK